MIVLDTTVLVYAVGAEHRFREPCRMLVEAVQEGEITATTTVEAIQEFTHVRARRRDRTEAVDLAQAYLDLLSPLLVITETELREGLRLFAAYHRLGAFDSVLAAAARSSGADALVSADGAFSSIPAVRHVLPDDDGIRSLLPTSPRKPDDAA